MAGATLGPTGWALSACQPQASSPPGGFVGPRPEDGHRLRTPQPERAPDEVRHTDVVIAGGGMAGLAAARALRAGGVEDFCVLDVQDAAGGNSRGHAMTVGGASIGCPMGAHYLPVPGDRAPEVQDWLEELGLRQRVAGRWVHDERHLCHSPQERLYFEGHWHEGLLPPLTNSGADRVTALQYQSFSNAVREAQAESAFALPGFDRVISPAHRRLDGVTFAAWLQARGLTDPRLRWYLDYCCRDDFGAGADTVSAWAGLHYFGSRHGFHPGGESGGSDAVLTWPQGNGWLVERLSAPLGVRLRCAQLVQRITTERSAVSVDSLDLTSGRLVRWQARRCIVALPVHVAARVVVQPPDFLRAVAQRLQSASWVVVNLALREPLDDRPGAAPAWDNVVFGGSGLGYVDARHQSLDARPGPTVLTWYGALGASAAARQGLLDAPWTTSLERALSELRAPHPDLPHKLVRADVVRHGHAMAVPEPGLKSLLSDASRAAASWERLSFAHSDWAGYSVLEEAFTMGHRRATSLLKASRVR